MSFSPIVLADAQRELAAGSASAAALAEACLQRCSDPQGQGRAALTSVYGQSARAQAQASDAVRATGAARSALEGIPVTIKDLFAVRGQVTTAGGQALASDRVAAAHSAVVQRLLDAGAVITGRTNMTEFAYSGLGINPHRGTPLNPWQRDQARIPGGSSSGAAVAVTDAMCVASVGTDTGGSARIPAALCGITGFKPTAERIAQTGVVPLSPSLDSVGVMAADVHGCAQLYGVLAGANIAPGAQDLRRARFAVPRTLVQDGLSAEVAAAFDRALRTLSESGAELVEIDAPEFLELAAFNAHGGFSAAESYARHAQRIESAADSYDPKVLSRILRGKGFLAKDYLELQRQRADWRQRVDQRLAGFDGWLMPTVPQTAPRLQELLASDERYFQTNAALLRNPSIVNFHDGCAISLPCATDGALPVGISLAAPAHHDHAVLAWGAAIESALRR